MDYQLVLSGYPQELYVSSHKIRLKGSIKTKRKTPHYLKYGIL